MKPINKEIYILGVGHNTIVYIDLVEACGYSIKGLYHYNNDRVGQNVHGYPIIDTTENLLKKTSLSGNFYAISVGDNEIRTQLANRIREKGGNVPTLIHPTAVVSRFSEIEEGVVIHINSVVQGDTLIKQDTVLSYNSSVSHNSQLGKGCYLAANSIVGAYVNVGEKVLIGISSILVSAKANLIGKNSIIGAGSVVINNVDENSIVAGNPAKELYKKK